MSAQRRVVVSGASGLIGTALVDRLRQTGHEVRRLVRRQPRYADEFYWNPLDGTIDHTVMELSDAVVHLSGANIGAKRWTDERKEVLRSSRIATTSLLAETMAQLRNPPGVFVSQSAIGIYGDRGDELLNDYSGPGPGDDFLAGLTVDWERAARRAARAGIRVVHPRTGLVLARDAALIQRLLPIFKAGLGGPLGDGSQWWSWVSLRDTVEGIIHLLKTDLSGPVNLVAPNPVRQAEFVETLASALGRRAFIPVPELGLKLVLGAEKAEAIGLSSARVVPERLLASGYEFSDTELGVTLGKMFGTAEDDRSRSRGTSGSRP
jgi:uncharacterized protein (TIGR01777 family)